MKRILVTGAGGNASRNFVESLNLSSESFHIVGSDTNKIHLECSPLHGRYLLPPCKDPSYLKKLCKLIELEKIDFIHPQPDPEVDFISAHRAQIPVKQFLPSHSTIARAQDKVQTNTQLKKANVPCPLSFHLKGLEQLSDILASLQKPNQPSVWLRAILGAGSKAALPIQTVQQAEQWIDYWRCKARMVPTDFMLSELLPGSEFAFQSLWKDGQLITSMARERIEYMFGNIMPSGQSSSPSIAKTVHRDDVNEIATQAIRAIDPVPHGVYCVDLKEDAQKKPCVTEINAGRFFTTSNFLSSAGLNMPYYYTKLAFGETLPSLKTYNAVEKDLYWVRGVDRQPRLFRGEQWTSKQVE